MINIVLELPEESIPEITEEIMSHSNESCYLGSLPATGSWADFQDAWRKAIGQ